MRETQAGSGAGGHEGGEDVIGAAAQILASPVIAHCAARADVTGSDLDSAQTTPAESNPKTTISQGRPWRGLAVQLA
jgi:hypothetical protein